MTRQLNQYQQIEQSQTVYQAHAFIDYHLESQCAVAQIVPRTLELMWDGYHNEFVVFLDDLILVKGLTKGDESMLRARIVLRVQGVYLERSDATKAANHKAAILHEADMNEPQLFEVY